MNIESILNNQNLKNLNVIVTGFDVFFDYKTNPSWEAVNLLEIDFINLIKKKIKVSYGEVDKIIPDLWNKYDICFMLHVGVSHKAKEIILEYCAHSNNYSILDVDKCKPIDGCCQIGLNEYNSECLNTKFNLEDIQNKLNTLNKQGKLNIRASISKDAGRYVCEYIYFTSLKCSKGNSLFVHVPTVGDKLGYKIEDLKDAIQVIIEYLVEYYFN